MALVDPLYAQSPTVEVGGQSLPLLQSNLHAMRMREAIGGLSSLELCLVDSVQVGGTSQHAADAGSPLKLGAGIRVFAGPHDVGAPEIFDGQITAVEAEVREGQPPLFTVLAEDRLFSLRRRRRSRLFEAQSLSDLVTAIVQDHGLTAAVRDGVDSTARDWVQTDETDLGFLRRCLLRFDCDVQVVGDSVQVGRVGMDRRSLVPLQVGTTLLSARITADVAEQVSALTLGNFDPVSGEAVDARGEARGFGPGTGDSGPDILGRDFSAVAMHLGRYGPLNDSDATKLAELEGERRARGFVRVDGTARGDGNLRVGSWVEIAGVNPQFAGQYAVRSTVHRFDGQDGYRTDFIAESAYLGEAQ